MLNAENYAANRITVTDNVITIKCINNNLPLRGELILYKKRVFIVVYVENMRNDEYYARCEIYNGLYR